MEYATLNNGLKMPSFGLGTYKLVPEDARRSVFFALKSGYRMIDTANIYGNEKSVGLGIKDSGIDRKEIFLASKIWPNEFQNDDAVNETLNRLGVDYLDLLFLHHPANDYIRGYKMLEKAYEEGKIKAIGLSNFEGKYLDEILSIAKHKPQVMQIEAHPYYLQEECKSILDQHDIKLESWYPLGHGNQDLLNEPVILEIASKHRKSPAQIILRWHLEMGYIVIPGSKNEAHIKENLEILNFQLDENDMKKIASLNKCERFFHRSQKDLDWYAIREPNYEK